MKNNLTSTGFELNSTFIDIFISPLDQNEDLSMRNVNLTWNVTSFNLSSLEIQLNFHTPLNISRNLQYDNITFHVINFTNIFKS